MFVERESTPVRRDAHWTELLAQRLGWTVLLAGGVLCAVAILLS